MNSWTDYLLPAFALYAAFRIFRLLRPRVRPAVATAAVAAGRAALVDVREAGEWKSGVAAGAVLLPLSDLQGKRVLWQTFLERNRGRRLLLYCQSGTRSGFAAARLRREGFDAVNLGTLLGWRLAGGSVVTPAPDSPSLPIA
jgi:rhodanese-related sulfurtransferase